MTHEDELRSRMSRLSESHQLGELTVDGVHARHDQRIRRQRIVGMCAVVLLVVAAAGVVRAISTGDDSDVDVATELPTDEPTTTTAPPTIPAPVANGALVPTTTVVFSEDFGTSSYYGGSNVVPWGDGFLQFEQVFVQSEVSMTDLVPDIADRFPPEVLDAIEAAGIENPGSGDLQESIDALTEAGLMDLVTEIFTGDPELLDAYNQVQSGGSYTFQASTSDDGINWTVLDGSALPGDMNNLDRMASNGSTVVIATSQWQGEGGATITVWSSSDLVNWSSSVLPNEIADAPSYVRVESYLSSLAVGAESWYVTTSNSTWIDLWSLVPADTRADFENQGYGWRTGPEGMTITRYDEEAYDYSYDSVIEDADFAADTTTTTVGPATTIPATTIPAGATTTAPPEPLSIEPTEPAPVPPPLEEPGIVEERLVPWSELGITEAEYNRYATEGDQAGAAYLGSFNGTFESVSPATSGGCCEVIATDAGFLASSQGVWNDNGQVSEPGAFFSADGRTWSEVSLPRSVSPGSFAAVDGGVVAGNNEYGGSVWRADADGTGWQQIDVAGLPDNAWLSFWGSKDRGVATVIDVQPPYESNMPAYTTVVEYEGYELRMEINESGQSSFRLTELDTGDVMIDVVEPLGSFDAPDFIGDSATGMQLLDENGDVIVEVPYEILSDATEAAYTAAIEESGWVEPEYNYEPDFWLVASTDGRIWHVEDLPETPNGYYGETAINGNTVIVRSSDTGSWQVFDIG